MRTPAIIGQRRPKVVVPRGFPSFRRRAALLLFSLSALILPPGHVFDWPANHQHSPAPMAPHVRLAAATIATGNTLAVSSNYSNAGTATAVVKTDGTVWTWGVNNYGQLGDKKTTNSASPIQVSGLSGITAVAAGQQFFLALKPDGTVWAWGRNDSGELGNGTFSTSGCYCSDVATQVSGLTGVKKLIVNRNSFSLVLKSDGTVWGWGINTYGQLGNGSTTNSDVPVQVSGLTNAVQVSDDQDTNSGAPINTALALDANGAVWAWGSNYLGQVGNGTFSTNGCGCIDAPVQLTGLTGVTQVLTGGDRVSVALKGDGTLWDWGYNFYGQLGDGNTSNSDVPVQVSGLTRITSAVGFAEDNYFGLALRSDGTVWAWGQNSSGQLGNGTTTSSYVPVQVSGLTGVTDVSIGDVGAFAVALRGDGTAWAWGDNSYGNLGNGTTGQTGCYCSDVAVQVNGLTHVTALGAGNEETAALKADGTVWDWGYNRDGEMGNGTTTTTGCWCIDAPVQASITGVAQAGAATQQPLSGGPITLADAPTGNGCYTCSAQALAQGLYVDPVNSAYGNLIENVTDMAVDGRGLSLQFARTYQSNNASTNGPLGFGWASNVFMSLAQPGGTGPVTITEEGGAQVVFNQSGSTYVPSAPRYIATLIQNGGGTWTFTRLGQTTYTFNSSGQLTSEVDRNGYTTTFTHNGSNQLTTLTDSTGRTLSLGWSGNNITTVSDANVTPARTVSLQYNDGNGDLTDVIDVNGGHTHYGYDPSHRLTTMQDPVCYAAGVACNGGNGTQTHYNVSGQVDWQKDQLGRQTSFAYSGDPKSAAGGSTTITDPKGNQILDTYQYGLRTAETRGYGTTSAATRQYLYDPYTAALATTIDPRGNRTNSGMDSSGNVLWKGDALGRFVQATYNSSNEPLTKVDGNGVTTTYTYDVNGNVLSVSTPLAGTSQAQVTTYAYGDAGHLGDVTAVTDPDGRTTSYQYDSYGNRVETKDPLGHVTAAVYNADNWLTARYTAKAGCTWGSAPPAGCSSTYETEYSYLNPSTLAVDEFGDPQVITDPLGHAITYGYDADRNVTSVQDGDGNTTTHAYDLDNEQCWVLPGGASTNGCSSPPANARVTDYNADGSVSDQKDGRGNAILTLAYDSLARPTSVTDALGNTSVYTYDGAGNALTETAPVANATCTGTKVGCTTYTYDADNELLTTSYSDSPSDNITSISYDKNGQRTGMVDGTGTSVWAYDSLRRLTSYTNGSGATVSYGYTYGSGPTYDLTAQVRSIGYPNGVGTVTQSWNADSTLASVTDWNSNTTTFSYDANANETNQTVPSTVSVTDTFGVDAADRITSISDSNGSTLFAATYTRDGNGQLTSDSSQAGNQSAYKYTSLNQLCYAASTSSNTCSSPPANSYRYAFDNADNLTSNNGATQQYSSADELCWAVNGNSSNNCGTPPSGATTYTYDTKGNRTHIAPTTGAQTCNTFDQANRLTQIQTGTGTSCRSAATLGAYGYDGDGLRESKTVSGTTTHFTWAGRGAALLQQFNGTTKTSYIYGPGGLPIEQVAGSAITYLHHDQIGSTRVITDAAGVTGTATTFTFDPYGNQVSSSGSLATNLRFQGQYLDSESGLYYLRARYYDPTTGQFLTVDPAVAKTMSPYGYTQGDPLNSSDPTGLDNDYYYSWDMGPARSGGPQATLWWLTHRADYEFPFTIHDLASSYTVHGPGAISDVGGTTSTLCAGNNYAISAAAGSQPIHVDFAGMQGNVAVLQFTALPGHVEGTGSTIRFSSWVSADGHQHFDVTGHDTYSYDGVPLGFPFGPAYGGLTHVADALLVQSMWNQLATKVNGGSYPGG
jgi:RHS repeat-associated protein